MAKTYGNNLKELKVGSSYYKLNADKIDVGTASTPNFVTGPQLIEMIKDDAVLVIPKQLEYYDDFDIWDALVDVMYVQFAPEEVDNMRTAFLAGITVIIQFLWVTTVIASAQIMAYTNGELVSSIIDFSGVNLPVVYYNHINTTGTNQSGNYVGEFKPAGGVIPVTYSNLGWLKTNNRLVPGQKYRITDYMGTINGTYDLSPYAGSTAYFHYAKSAEHQFDIIVEATSSNSFGEKVQAALHQGDEYFSAAGSRLDQWEVNYCFDNDTTKYTWASPNGAGVITYMKDEFGNEAGYDFKNIMFLAYGVTKIDDNQNQYSNAICYNDDNETTYCGSPVYFLEALIQMFLSGSSSLNNTMPFVYQYIAWPNLLTALSYSTVDANYLSTFSAQWYYTFDLHKPNNTPEHIDCSLNDFSLNNINKTIVCKNNKIAQSNDILGFLLYIDMITMAQEPIMDIPLGLPLNCFITDDFIAQTGPFCQNNTIGPNAFGNIIKYGFIFNENLEGIFTQQNIIVAEATLYKNYIGANSSKNIIINSDEVQLYGKNNSCYIEESQEIYLKWMAGINTRHSDDITLESEADFSEDHASHYHILAPSGKTTYKGINSQADTVTWIPADLTPAYVSEEILYM